jgi:hypothetical protein
MGLFAVHPNADEPKMMRVYIILAPRRQYHRTPDGNENVILRRVSGNGMKGCVNYPTLKISKLK